MPVQVERDGVRDRQRRVVVILRGNVACELDHAARVQLLLQQFPRRQTRHQRLARDGGGVDDASVGVYTVRENLPFLDGECAVAMVEPVAAGGDAVGEIAPAEGDVAVVDDDAAAAVAGRGGADGAAVDGDGAAA